MWRLTILAAVVAVLGFTDTAGAQGPQWSLGQNDPNPFCNGEGSGGTAIPFAVARTSRARLAVLPVDPGATGEVRTLVDGMLAAGFHVVVWDGRDEAGGTVPNGTYPYRLTITEEGSGNILFQDTKSAQVECTAAVVAATWEAVKALFKE